MADFQQILDIIRRAGLAGPVAALGPSTAGLRDDTAEGGQGLLSGKNIAEAAQRVFTGTGNILAGPNAPVVPQAAPLANEVFQQPVIPTAQSGVAEASEQPTVPPEILTQAQIVPEIFSERQTVDSEGGLSGNNFLEFIKSIAPQAIAAGVGQIPGALPGAAGFSTGLTNEQKRQRISKEKSEEKIAKRVRKREEERDAENSRRWEKAYAIAFKQLKPTEFGIPPTDDELRKKAVEIHNLIYGTSERAETTLSKDLKGTLSDGITFEEV